VGLGGHGAGKVPSHSPMAVPVPLTSVDDLLDGFGHLPLEQGVEDFDQEDEAHAEHDEGPGQQHQPHGQVGQRRVGEEVLACPTAWLGEGLGPAQPCSQTCPSPRQSHTWTPAPTSRLQLHVQHPSIPQKAPPAPPQPCPSPCTHSHFCLVTLWRLSMPLVLQWPGAVQFREDPSPMAAVCRETVGCSWLHSILSQSLSITHPL